MVHFDIIDDSALVVGSSSVSTCLLCTGLKSSPENLTFMTQAHDGDRGAEMGVEKLGGSIHPESCFVRLENRQLLCYAGYFQGLFQGRNLFKSLSVSGPPPCLQSGGTSGVFKMKLISWASLPEILIELVTGRAQASGIFQTNKQAEPRTHGN